jgi:chemotaxis protein MotB
LLALPEREVSMRSHAHVARLLLGVAPALLSIACVPQGKYDAAVSDAERAHADALNAQRQVQQYGADLASARQQLGQLTASLQDVQARMAERDKALATLQGSSQDLQKKLDAAIAEDEQLRKELGRLGKNADALFAEKGTLAKALADARARLDELRKAQAAADARAALFRQLALKFNKMIDAGQLKIVLRNGRMVLQLPNDVLFDSGQTTIKPQGRLALAQIASVLRTIPDRRFQVAGDTDNVPIETALYPSNWELSTRRAVEVVRFLVAEKMRPEALSAAGYGEFDPVAPNDTADGRAKNRRIEITLQPNIDELVAVPNASAS